MLPLVDESALVTEKPKVTIILIILNTVIFFISLLLNPVWVILNLGMIPSHILAGQNLYTIFTAMFLHANLLHLAGNMWFLWLFGPNIENTFGKWRYLLLYLVAGVAASVIDAVSVPLLGSLYTQFLGLAIPYADIPRIGASGAIASLIGCYLVLYPGNKLKSLVWLGFTVSMIDIPAWIYALIWLGIQVFYSLTANVSVGFIAHLGGVAGGIVLALLLKKQFVRQDFVEDQPIMNNGVLK